MLNSDKDTLFLFPEQCSMGIVNSSVDDSIVSINFSTLGLDLNKNDNSEFDDIYHLVRKSQLVRITHLPGSMAKKDSASSHGNSMIVSFYAEQNSSQDQDSPLIAAVISLDKQYYLNDLDDFNKHIVNMESLGFSLSFGEEKSVLMLLELQSISKSFIENLQVHISNFVLVPVYYAEFNPKLDDTLEPIMRALNHRRTTKHLKINAGAIDLSGIIPDGLA